MRENLTKTEKIVLDYLLQGLSSKVIAFKMDVSVKTTKNHITKIFKAHNVQSRPQLLALYLSFPSDRNNVKTDMVIAEFENAFYYAFNRARSIVNGEDKLIKIE